MREITIKIGVIYDKHGVISAAEADKIAKANDFEYAEDFINQYNGKKLELDNMDHVKAVTDGN